MLFQNIIIGRFCILSMLISLILQAKTQKQGLAVEKKSIKEKGYISIYLKLLSAGHSYWCSSVILIRATCMLVNFNLSYSYQPKRKKLQGEGGKQKAKKEGAYNN